MSSIYSNLKAQIYKFTTSYLKNSIPKTIFNFLLIVVPAITYLYNDSGDSTLHRHQYLSTI
ncbi:MAG TPA: hypothetical protein PLQ78_03040 [Flavipsychrobacter sp.]|nr:hypothetical protein [Flavipsychrobacter sp.]